MGDSTRSNRCGSTLKQIYTYVSRTNAQEIIMISSSLRDETVAADRDLMRAIIPRAISTEHWSPKSLIKRRSTPFPNDTVEYKHDCDG